MIEPILGKKMKNQITEYIYPVEELKNYNFFALAVKVGSASEKKDCIGTAHFLEHVQMRFFDEKEEDYFCSAYTDFYYTVFYFDVKSGALDKVINLIQGIIEGKFLNEFDINKIREEILEEYESFMKKNVQADFRYLLEHTEYAEYLPIGTYQNICKISKKDIQEFYKKFYLFGNTCLIWIGSEQDIDKKGTKWIENLRGLTGETKPRLLDYKFPNGKTKLLKGEEAYEVTYYFYRKRRKKENALNEGLLFIMENILRRYVGEIQIKKIDLSYQEEFLQIIVCKNIDFGKIQEKISLEKLKKQYQSFLEEQDVGCNCNVLREQLINCFVFHSSFLKKGTNIEEDMNILLDMLKGRPLTIIKE